MIKIICFIFIINCFSVTIGQTTIIFDTVSNFTENLEDIPHVKGKWRDFIIANTIPLTSISSDDFSDLQFLKEILIDKKYVFLGESTHYAYEFSEIKFRLIRFLVQELDFDVIVFESNIWNCYQLKLLKDHYTSKELLDRTIYAVWNTQTLQELISYIMKNNLEFAGFDIKPSAYKNDYYFEQIILSAIDSTLSSIAYKCSLEFSNFYKNRNLTCNKIHMNQVLSDHSKLFTLLTKYQQNGKYQDLDIYQKEIQNRIRIINSCIIDDKEYVNEYRDSLMSVTLQWLTEEIYPGKKIILWAHNGHISKNNLKRNKPMGSFLPETILNASYIIGFYMYSGVTFSDKIIEVRKPYKNSLEALMIQPNYKYSFFDLSNRTYSDETSWMFNEISSLLWGRFKRKIVLNKSYDAILFIDKISLPNHNLLKY